MTRQEFVAAYRHEIEGWCLDCSLAQRSGAELSVFLRALRARIEGKLGAMYDALQPVPPPARPNGQAQATIPLKR